MSYIGSSTRSTDDGRISLWRELPTIATSANATPFTLFSFPLVAGRIVRILVNVVVADSTFERGAEWQARCTWLRSNGGVSVRLGTANGIQDSVANTFTAQRPSITFGDPSASHVASVIATGKAATNLTWLFWAQWLEARA